MQTAARTAPAGPPPGPLQTPGVKIAADVIYGHKDGMALTFDVFTPPKPNRAAVIHVVSGGWVSRYAPPTLLPVRERQNYDELLGRGFTVISLRHGAAPRYNVPEIIPDIHRGVRFIRLNAAKLGVDPARIGIYGNSSGAHLSLMVGLKPDAGDPMAEDEVLRTSNRVAAIVSYYAPANLDPNAKSVLPAETFETALTRYPALRFDYDKFGKEVSPVTHVSADDPPVLVLHGDKDVTVPVKEGETLHREFKAKGVTTEFIVFPGAGHAFQGEDAARATKALGDWFTKHLNGTVSSVSPQ
jgi:acetyl esterase/lipase